MQYKILFIIFIFFFMYYNIITIYLNINIFYFNCIIKIKILVKIMNYYKCIYVDIKKKISKFT